MLTALAFVFAIGLLVFIHEGGHFLVARLRGVKVLQFSVGFGPALWQWESPATHTRYSVGSFPLGGYVRMLDSQQGPLSDADAAQSLNAQPLLGRAAIVVAGPVANLAFAFALYAGLFFVGIEEPAAVLATPAAGSLAADAGFQGKERIVRVAHDDEAWEDVLSYSDFQWHLTQAVLAKHNLLIEYREPITDALKLGNIRLEALDTFVVDAQLFQRVGMTGPWSQARIEGLMPDSVAARSGLQVGDVVLQIDAMEIVDARQLRDTIRLSGDQSVPTEQQWWVRRGAERISLFLTPGVVNEGARSSGRIGALIGAPPQMTTVHYGVWTSLARAAEKTWEVSAMTLRMLTQMLTGSSSVKNLSGPLSIADYAGKSASMGLPAFVTFLALISISLAVLNLLPVPMLDGGHLLYYFWEWVSGSPVSESLMVKMQQFGMCLLFILFSIALFNDAVRFSP